MAAQRAIDQRREELAQIDSVIRMFAPDINPDMIAPIRPGSHGLFFSYRELPRLCLDILHKAKGPIRFDAIVDQVVDAKGFGLDGHLRRHVYCKARECLLRLAQRGIVRRVVDAPDVWWELAGRSK